MSSLIIQKKDIEDVWDFIFAALEDRIIGKSRWSIKHEIVFKWTDGKCYRTYYSEAATENQQEQPWEYDNEIKCEEVVMQKHSGYEWVKVEDAITQMVEGDLYG